MKNLVLPANKFEWIFRFCKVGVLLAATDRTIYVQNGFIIFSIALFCLIWRLFSQSNRKIPPIHTIN